MSKLDGRTRTVDCRRTLPFDRELVPNYGGYAHSDDGGSDCSYGDAKPDSTVLTMYSLTPVDIVPAETETPGVDSPQLPIDPMAGEIYEDRNFENPSGRELEVFRDDVPPDSPIDGGPPDFRDMIAEAFNGGPPDLRDTIAQTFRDLGDPHYRDGYHDGYDHGHNDGNYSRGYGQGYEDGLATGCGDSCYPRNTHEQIDDANDHTTADECENREYSDQELQDEEPEDEELHMAYLDESDAGQERESDGQSNDDGCSTACSDGSASD